MIKFETGRCSCHGDDVHQRKESQIKGELSLINHMKGEQITVALINIKLRVICHFKFHYGFVLFALICLFDVEVLKTQHSFGNMKLE